MRRCFGAPTVSISIPNLSVLSMFADPLSVLAVCCAAFGPQTPAPQERD
jgi:hypothetical protein